MPPRLPPSPSQPALLGELCASWRRVGASAVPVSVRDLRRAPVPQSAPRPLVRAGGETRRTDVVAALARTLHPEHGHLCQIVSARPKRQGFPSALRPSALRGLDSGLAPTAGETGGDPNGGETGGDPNEVDFGGTDKRRRGSQGHRHCPRYFCGAFYEPTGQMPATAGDEDVAGRCADARARPGTRGTRRCRCRRVTFCDSRRDVQRPGRAQVSSTGTDTNRWSQ
jgi:hypothetical protein